MQKHRTVWLAITGQIEATESGLTFVWSPRPAEDTDNEKALESSWYMARSSSYFESGEITGEMLVDDPATKVQFRLGNNDTDLVIVGFNLKDGAYGIAQRTSGKDTVISKSGIPSSLPVNTWLPFSIEVVGARIALFVHGVRVASGSASISRAQVELVFRGKGKAELRNLVIRTVKPRAFIVMQFTAEFDALYQEVIAPVCTEFGYEAIRGDDVYTNGLIIEDIANSIRDASIVIADITPNNANVYYEVGFAHGIARPTILLSDRRREKLPFDISGFRLIYYENTIGGKSSVEAALRKHLSAMRA